MIVLGAARRCATAAQLEQALAALEQAAGAYFGVDAGIPGLHPQQATLIHRPALVLRLYGDGLEVEALTPRGLALLELPELAQWKAGLRRGPGHGAVAALRGFLACFAPSPDVLLLGALPFRAYQLANPGSGDEPLGTLFFGEQLLRRDAAGTWEQVQLQASDLLQAAEPGLVPAPASPSATSRLEPGDDHPPGGYAGMVRRALDWLRARPLVSLTLSQSYRRAVTLSASQAFARLRAANPAPASFFLNDGCGQRLFGASPDLQLVVAKRVIEALPVCGTVARRSGATGEAESLRELLNEEVDAASLAVCTDALRNDLAPLCEPGSLRLVDRRRPLSLATVVHAVDRLRGTLRQGADAWDAIVATAAPVMVTGTPRAQALEAIGQLEASPRGWYGGMMVQVASNGDALTGTILRAATVRNGVAEVRTGGDLMADSSPEREEQESRLKTLSLWRAFGLETAAGAASNPLTEEEIALPRAIRLVDANDPFGQAVRECLQGLGLELAGDARPSLLVGDVAGSPELDCDNAVALGDAALSLLAGSGFSVQPQSPEHGRLLQCTATPDAPWRSSGPFSVARYATLGLENQGLRPGWQAWAVDAQGSPVVLAHAKRRLVALLFRPESLLSDPQALQVLRAALAFAAAKQR